MGVLDPKSLVLGPFLGAPRPLPNTIPKVLLRDSGPYPSDRVSQRVSDLGVWRCSDTPNCVPLCYSNTRARARRADPSQAENECIILDPFGHIGGLKVHFRDIKDAKRA